MARSSPPNSTDQYVVAGNTITLGAPAVTISGGLISIPAQNLFTLTVDGQIITANSADQHVVAGHTTTPSAPASGTSINIPVDLQPTRAIEGITKAGSRAYPYTLGSAGDIVLASKTLKPGGSPITVERRSSKQPMARAWLSCLVAPARPKRWLMRLLQRVALRSMGAASLRRSLDSIAVLPPEPLAQLVQLQLRRLLLLLRVVYRRLILWVRALLERRRLLVLLGEDLAL